MTSRTTHRPTHRPTNAQAHDAVQWRRLLGPGHQFPVMTDTVLHYWPDRH